MTESSQQQKTGAGMLAVLSSMPVGRKILILVSFSFVVLFSISTLLQSRQLSGELVKQAGSASEVITELMASQLPLAIRFNKPENIQKVYMPLAQESQTTLASFAAVNAKGEMVDSYQSKTLEHFDLGDVFTQSILSLEEGQSRLIQHKSHDVVVAPVFDKKGSKTGTIAIAWSNHLISEAIRSSLTSQLIVSVVAISVVIITLMFLVGNVLTKALVNLTSSMNELASGNSEVEITGLDRQDDIGAMTRAVQVFKDNAARMIQLQDDEKKHKEAQEEQAQRIDQENRAREEAEAKDKQKAEEEAQRQRTEMMQNLANSFEARVMKLLENVTNAVSELNITANELSQASTVTTTEAGSAEVSAQQAGENVQAVAGASEEMASSVAEVSSQVVRAADMSSAAVQEAEQAGSQVKDLSLATDKIDEVVALINDIAEQTNLLALNATIEAARAGDAGRGFAVVASEVKALAEQTGKATNEIAEQIGNVQSVSTSAVGSVNSIAETIRDISEVSATIATAVEEQSSATQEISRSSQGAATGTQEVGQSISKVRGVADQTNSIADQVLKASDELAQQASDLGAEVSNFLQEIRGGQ